MLSSKQREYCLKLFKTDNAQFVENISNKNVYKILEDINELRNHIKGHGGAVSEEVDKKDLYNLENYLNKVRNILNYEDLKLILPGRSEHKDGIFNTTIKSLMGSKQIFITDECETTVPMNTAELYLLDTFFKIPLKLVPFIRIDTSPAKEKNTCYFYNSINKDKSRWISYHSSENRVRTYGSNEVINAIEMIVE